MKKIFLLVVVACATLLCGCSTHFYASSNSSVSRTEVVLSKNNFRIIGQAEGAATVSKVLGIGGCSRSSVHANAVGEMFKNANLRGSQTIININVKQAVTGLPPFFTRTTYSATGTIVEFIE